jgi:hypothetical protein
MFTKTNKLIFFAKSDVSSRLARTPPPDAKQILPNPFFICAKELPTETKFNTGALSTSLTSDREKKS